MFTTSALTLNILFIVWRTYLSITRKMRLFLILCFFICIDARKKVSRVGTKIPPNIGPHPSNDANVPLPVFFDHVGREGVGDLPSGLKQPIDLLELDMFMPKTEQEKRYHLRRKSLTDIQFIEKEYSNPRDRYINAAFFENAKNNTNPKEDQHWFDFENIHNDNDQKNLQKSRPKPSTKLRKKEKNHLITPDVFSEVSFDLKALYKKPSINWTKCDNFMVNSQFHPKDVVGFDWVPFYAWTTRPHVVAYLHKFSYPTVKVVQEYKDRYGPFLSSKIDWSEPKLLLKEEVEALLISADRRGLFYLIKAHDLPKNLKATNTKFKIPEIIVRFKIVDPYLALMYCVDHYAILMAISGDDPQSDEEKMQEAAKLKFEGIGFPIARDIAFEKLQEQILKQRKIEEENTKYIRAIGDVNGDNNY